jgi:uncharacterized membrane protein/protein-disulfide isomerase
MTSKSRTLLLAFALFGLAVSSFSSYVHYQALTQPAYESVCDVNETWSCTKAYLSPYGSFRGVPVALGGVLYFVLVLLLAGVAGGPRSRVRENAPGYIFALSTVALAFVLYLGYASFFILKARCILCLLTYAAVIAIFVVSGGAVTFPMTTLPRRAARDLRTMATSPAALIITLLFAGGAALLVTAFPRESAASPSGGSTSSAAAAPVQALNEQQMAELQRWWDVQPSEKLPIDAGGAKVLVVKFSDFMCPACKATHDAYKSLLAKYTPQQVRFVLKHFPLEPECNPQGAPGGNHFASCEASAATEMARASGKADAMTDWLFANQPKLSPALVKDGVKEVAGVADFDAKYAQALQEVRKDAAMGAELKIGSTPTFFINGRRLAAGVPPQYFDGIIQLELKKK